MAVRWGLPCVGPLRLVNEASHSQSSAASECWGGEEGAHYLTGLVFWTNTFLIL